MDTSSKAWLAAALWGGLALPAQAVPQYTVTDLGSLVYGEVMKIGADGDVTGTLTTPSHFQHALSYSESTGVVDLGTLGGRRSGGLDVNAGGQITGWSDRGLGVARPFLYAPGSGMTDLGTLGGVSGGGNALNDAGQVTGWANRADGSTHAFLYTDGTGMADLGMLNYTEWDVGVGINGHGQVIGRYMQSGYQFGAFMYTPGGGVVDIGHLGGGETDMYALNDAGQAVGWSRATTTGGTRAVIYRNGALVDLNALIGGTTGWLLEKANDINDRGEIIGMGLFEGSWHAFLMKPNLAFIVPELDAAEGTGALALLAGALALAGERRRRNQRPDDCRT
jgi:probable HAF family extracellular repeat protein